jgi:hypothetical protein
MRPWDEERQPQSALLVPIKLAASPRRPRTSEPANHHTMGRVGPIDDAVDHSVGPVRTPIVVRHAMSITEPGKWKLRVLDINPGRLGRVVAVREPGKDGRKVQERLAVTAPSIISAGLCFLHDIKSSLPYYELKRSGVVGNFFMDDEWIAEIKVGFNYSDEVDI